MLGAAGIDLDPQENQESMDTRGLPLRLHILSMVAGSVDFATATSGCSQGCCAWGSR